MASAVELGSEDTAELQRFFDENPEYFVIVTGRAAHASEAEEEIGRLLPDGWPFTKKWVIGFVDQTDSVIGMADVVSDLLAGYPISSSFCVAGLTGTGRHHAMRSPSVSNLWICSACGVR